jgi:hypothetical protein
MVYTAYVEEKANSKHGGVKMKKKELSPIELKKVVELRQLGAKWTEIEHETKVERRAAKRAYEEWERDKKMKEQEAARFRVAAEAFHEHLNDLVRLAQALINHLSLPSGPNDTRSAKQHLSNLWQTSILEQPKPYAGYEADRNRQIRSIEYLNLMIFKSLQDHTHEKVRWQALGQWEKAWDTCKEELAKFREEAREMMVNDLNQKLIDRIVKESGKKDAVERMMDGVLYTVWPWILTGKPDEEFRSVQATPRGDGTTEVTFGKGHLTVYLIFAELDLAKEVAKVCEGVAEKLYKRDTASALANEVNIMQEGIKELEETLHPLRLRPVILRTRCDLCPA